MLVICRKAVDSGKQSGNIATLLGLCNQIWSGPETTASMSSGWDGAVDSTDDHSHSFESSRTENTTFQSWSSTLQATCNDDSSDESNEDEDTESSLECENTKDV